MPENLKMLAANLSALGPRRLMLMAGVFVLVLMAVGIGSTFLNRPAYQPLYVGLERDDVTRMGMVLGEAGIVYDVNAEGTTLMVPAGMTGRARMILAEKGLPSSAGAGYELFDNLGSLGLTSFMQEVTRVRALEGEIARSIQTISGVKGARVHIVMAERGNFRRAEQVPTASVIVRFDRAGVESRANAVRHLVAAAVPGMVADNVTVLDSAGRLLAAGEDPLTNSASSAIGIEATVENQVADGIHRALAATLGAANFRVSVQADINTDQRQIEETIFDPDSRIERSVQIVRAEDAATEQLASEPVTVEQDLPQDAQAGAGGGSTNERSERREETTNYELSSTRTATISNGYNVDRLSIAVVVNRARLVDAEGQPLNPAAVEERLAQIRTVAAAAAGIVEDRGDVLNITAFDFVEGVAAEGSSAPGAMASLNEHLGTAINAFAFIAVILAVIFLAVRPMINVLRSGEFAQQVARVEAGETPLLANEGAGGIGDGSGEALADMAAESIRLKPAPEERLSRIIDMNEERAAQILRRWLNNEAVSSDA
ncbi:MAG: flagellar M-ring protein FliF [Roseitalea sp.]|nr:flagellar M-ring protein FliF [Roseitalea sp.]MBO6951106.1 flagellar M-ring protein FliF [Rhizobiaceae bacterium]MBO6590907.1 flagellar M-ring protein FliF [Roseitalea sp.]MBO6599835.1 flagellar M-ring protein FliF [Roseitalea sp.]MBO6611591.1 flagellar M-ring protein FliF [Roseitalea sp.]